MIGAVVLAWVLVAAEPARDVTSSPTAANDAAAVVDAPDVAPAQDTPSASPTIVPPIDDEVAGHWTFGAVPKLTLNSDDGFGFGARGTLYWHRLHTKPYKTAITLQAFMTTKLVQQHFARIDALDVFELPLRLEGEVGYYQTLTYAYCGNSNVVTCVDDPRTWLRSIEPYASLNARFRFNDRPHKLEAFAGWRGTYYVPGSWSDDDKDGKPDLAPYPGSAYALRFPHGEPGLVSVVQAGVSLDNRDYEPAPSRGYWIDASLRGASPLTGSAYTFGAANLTARLYAPLNPERTVVLATRSVVDVIVGDAPVRELGRVGGLAEALAFGGLDLGRGIRLGRYPAPTKLLQQMEVRWDVMHVDVWHNDIGLMLAGFMDAGLLAFSPTDVGLHFGAGISGRLAWNKAFILRLDIGFSPDEGSRIGAYSSPNHPY